MDLKAGTWLIPPSVNNHSCNHPRYTESLFGHIGFTETIQALLILMLTLGIIGANSLLIFVINHRRYTAYIQPQPRYLLTSLALNDFAIGVLITPFGVLPALFKCWPYGEIFCQIQALLRGALSQQSAVILVCMAVDRYMCAIHPDRYHMHSSKKACVAVLSLTWTLCLTVFGLLVLPRGYYYNSTGLLVCEPFYSKPSYRILATCSLYFPTTMILMYCYGSSFHSSRLKFSMHPLQQHHMHNHYHHHYHQQHQQQNQQQQQQQQIQQIQQQNNCVQQIPLQQPQQQTRHNDITPTTDLTMTTTSTHQQTQLPSDIGATGTGTPNANDKLMAQERRLSGSASRTMAAMSLSFIVMVTPWTIQEIVAACTGSKVPPFLDFIVTWIALSNSFLNPFLYWLLNAHFRRIARDFLVSKGCCSEESSPQKRRCCSISSECDPTTLPLPPGPPSSRPPPRPDVEGLSEKYWGEILERTVSSSSLHALQRVYGHKMNLSNPSSRDHGYLSNFSTSEPKLCEHVHDANCAKSRAFFNSRHSIKGLPDI